MSLTLKICPSCGETFGPREGQWMSYFLEMTFCSRACGYLSQRRRPASGVAYTRDELMTEWTVLRAGGCSRREAAVRLGITWATFDRAWWRAVKAGDIRAVDAGKVGRPHG